MTAGVRIFSVSEFVRSSNGEPIRLVVLETEESVIVVWYVRPGQEIAAHIHPQGQDTWTVLSGSADYGFQFKTEQFKVKPFVVSLSNHERLNRT